MTDKLADALRELLEVANLRGDNNLPHPCDDPKLWTARMQDAWDEAEIVLAEHEAAKAAAPEDVLEAIDIARNEIFPGTFNDEKWLQTIIRAALLQGVTLQREVVDALRLAAPIVWKDALNTACVLSCPTDEATAAQVAMNNALALLDQHARGG